MYEIINVKKPGQIYGIFDSYAKARFYIDEILPKHTGLLISDFKIVKYREL